MLALTYLWLAIALGDLLCRRFYRLVSVPHRYAAAIVVGILLSTWFTYLGGLLFANAAEPLLWADLLFFVAAAAATYWLSKKSPRVQLIETRPPGRPVYDWLTLGALFIAACVLLLATLYVTKQGRIRVSAMEATDFAPQSAIAQSFALGHNFPPECPYYAGQPIGYDFLFYFQAGNLEFLGLNLPWNISLLSLLGLMSMLALIMAMGELLFNSRVVARVGAAFVFFPGAIAFTPFSKSQTAIETWTPLVFANQRHLPGAIAVFLLLLLFLIDQYGHRCAQTMAHPNAGRFTEPGEKRSQDLSLRLGFVPASENAVKSITGFVFSGLLLGLLPFWSATVFIAAAAVLIIVMILLPYRFQVMLLCSTAAALVLSQLYFSPLREIGLNHKLPFPWGAVDYPSVTNIMRNFGLMFGAKWAAVIVALILASWFQWRFFIAFCVLLLLPFFSQLNSQILAGHTFLNIWLILANLFAAYGLWRLWKLGTPQIIGPVTAIAVAVLILAGGVSDFHPIYGRSYTEVNYERDDLVTWLRKETKPKAVFLTDRFLSHPVLLAGRRIFLGLPNSPVGYDFAKREPIYRQMFESKNPRQVFELLKQNHIDYVVFDDAVRHGQSIRDANEYLYARYFPKVYDDKENRHRKLVIYKVPESAPTNLVRADVSEPPVTVFQGGNGTGKAQFDNPSGLAVDSAGNIFVADTGNGRVQKFSPSGTFLTTIGQFEAPSGIAIDRRGNIYVAEIGSKHRVQKLTSDGKFIAEWEGPEPGFYGPRRIAIGPEGSIYVVDSGRNRIAKFSPDGQVLASWGSEGSDDGQFKGVSSVAVDPMNNKVYVADPINKRIQVFDSDGMLLTKWSVPEWGKPLGFEDVLIDADRGRVYASSAHMNTILVFDFQGNRFGTLAPTPPHKLDAPAALALAKDKLLILNTASSELSIIPLQNK